MVAYVSRSTDCRHHFLLRQCLSDGWNLSVGTVANDTSGSRFKGHCPAGDMMNATEYLFAFFPSSSFLSFFQNGEISIFFPLEEQWQGYKCPCIIFPHTLRHCYIILPRAPWQLASLFIVEK